MSTRKTICFVAGRSGGHIIPCITLARNYKQEDPTRELLLFSTNTSLDEHIVTKESPFDHWVPLPLENVPYTKWLRYPLFTLQLITSFIKSIFYLWKYDVQRVISLGGYISIPVCLAARLLRINVELFEVNVLPGKAISFLAPYATTISVCFEATKKHLPATSNFVLRDYPIRFSSEMGLLKKEDARRLVGLDATKKTLVIVGGSQGSLFINTTIKAWVTSCAPLHHNLQIIHQTGAADDHTNWQEFYRTLGIPAITFDYSHDMATYYAAADLIVCRAGAGTLFEIGFFNKQCITIPLETPSTDHQLHNGLTIAKLWPDLVTVIRQKTIEKNPQILFHELNKQLGINISKE